MKKTNVSDSFSANLKHLFGDFQFVVNTAIDDEDIKQFLFRGFKHILIKEKKYLIGNVIGLILLLSGVFKFFGLCIFLATLSYIGVQLVKFVSGTDEETFEEIKVELDQQDTIPQKSLTEYVNAQISKKKHDRRKS
ncbi:hypothetical protein [Viridibacillus arvi]|uniref:hypothetical protein n=1 Tax=Viridibacillus arvi TaxID=263475 RepID=UPI0034CD2497